MYHCHMRFYFIGRQSGLVETLEEMPPFEGFTHEFFKSDVPKEELAKKAGSIKNGNKGEEPAFSAPAEGMEGLAEMGRGKEQFNCNNSAGFVRLLRADEIECRVSVINERGLSLLLFKDARVDRKILDETFTPFGWRRTHQSIDGNLYCTVEIYRLSEF